ADSVPETEYQESENKAAAVLRAAAAANAVSAAPAESTADAAATADGRQERAEMSKSRGVLIVLVIAAGLWALTISSWQAGAVGDALGPTGVPPVTEEPTSRASPGATACVAIIAVTGLLAAMLGRAGRFVVLGLAAVAALGYGITALFAATAPGATGWPIIAVVAAGISVIGIIWVA